MRQSRLEDERRRRRDKWGIATCDNQMAKKRSRQSCEAEAAAAQQQGRHDNVRLIDLKRHIDFLAGRC